MTSTAVAIPILSSSRTGSQTRAAVRAATRLVRLAPSTLLRFILWQVGDLARITRPAARSAWRSRCLRTWADACLRTANVRVHVRGVAPTPTPFLLVANHLSYLDILVLASLVDGRFVARHDIGSWPVIGQLVRAGGAILVERGRRGAAVAVSATVRAALEDGSGVILFPEGTSTDGRGILPFRSSLFEPAVSIDCPVHTAALRYSTPVGSPQAADAVSWHGDMPFASHVWGLFELPRIDVFVEFSADQVAGSDRKCMAAAAHDSVLALHASVTTEVA